jgi:hypothetical protein
VKKSSFDKGTGKKKTFFGVKIVLNLLNQQFAGKIAVVGNKAAAISPIVIVHMEQLILLGEKNKKLTVEAHFAKNVDDIYVFDGDKLFLTFFFQ